MDLYLKVRWGCIQLVLGWFLAMRIEESLVLFRILLISRLIAFPLWKSWLPLPPNIHSKLSLVEWKFEDPKLRCKGISKWLEVLRFESREEWPLTSDFDFCISFDLHFSFLYISSLFYWKWSKMWYSNSRLCLPCKRICMIKSGTNWKDSH